MAYTVLSPVLLIVFNRPDTASEVFEKIREARPSRLYIAGDGPREGHLRDVELCAETRQIINRIDWPCEWKTLFSPENKGCKKGVVSAINWFFENEDEGIILEDDCLPSESFFYFCDEMLREYRYEEKVKTITGTNLQMGRKWGSASYYFSAFSNVWGWATWKRFWKKYDPALKLYDERQAANILRLTFEDVFLQESWLDIFKKLKANQIDTWDYQLQFITFFEHGLCITPNKNLISNIGFREDATHTNNPEGHAWHAKLPVEEIGTIIYTPDMEPQKEADYFFLRKEFYLDEKWRKFEKDKLFRRRLKRWLRRSYQKFKHSFSAGSIPEEKALIHSIQPFHTIDGWLSEAEALGLFSVAKKMPPGAIVVEIGSWKGKSTFCLARGISSGTVFALDPFNADSGSDNLSREEYKEKKGTQDLLTIFKENMHRLRVEDKVIPIKGYSYDLQDNFDMINFLFIDGDHSIEGCRRDFELYSPKIVRGGFIAFHDYYPDRKDLGPTYVIEQVISGNHDFSFYKQYDSLWIGRKN